MKPITYYLTLVLVVVLSGCVQDTCQKTATYARFEPVYMSYGDFRSSYDVEEPRTLENPGKIYFKEGYIFINEIDKGIHIIDNREPANPRMVAFIHIIGNRDMAAKGNILYADSHIDMLIIDISNPELPELIDRREDLFPYEMAFVNGNALWADESRGVVVDWNKEIITEELVCDENGSVVFPNNCPNCLMEDALRGGGIPSTDVPEGVGGSMARFTLARDHLYAVTNQQLIAFDIKVLTDPRKISEPYIGWDIETIFPYAEHLFIGSRTGMFIYNISIPGNPTFVSEFRHARNCDPVVVEGDYAYVTLRSGNPECDGFENELNVVDISRIERPFLVKEYSMHKPHGLGIRNSTLFVCDGEEGLKVYNAEDVLKIDQNQLAHFREIHAYDVIPLENILLLIGEDGFYQYDYSDIENIRLISRIPVTRS